MTNPAGRIPPGPVKEYSRTEELLSWMGAQFERFGDIYKASIYGSDVYVTRDPRHAQHVLRENWQNYIKGQAIKRVALLLGNGLMVSEGEFWKAQRRMIQPAFHRKTIGALTGIIATANAALLKRWRDAAHHGASVNVTRDVSSMILEIVLRSIFGTDYEHVAPHLSILTDESARNLEFARAFGSLAKIVRELAAQRRGKKTTSSDILGMLMEARREKSGQQMTDHQLVNEIKTLVVAGHETTASTLNWIWYLLSQHLAVAEKLSNELDVMERKPVDLADLPKFAYTRQVIEETMRLYPSGWLLTRKARKDDLLDDYFVPAGTEIYISPYFIQRNPALWDEPDRFNPDRFSLDRPQHRHPLAMLPFSAGPRNCIGELFARLEMQMHVTMIAKELRLRLVETRPPELDLGVNLRSKYDFVMEPQLKTPALAAAVEI